MKYLPDGQVNWVGQLMEAALEIYSGQSHDCNQKENQQIGVFNCWDCKPGVQSNQRTATPDYLLNYGLRNEKVSRIYYEDRLEEPLGA